MKVKKSMKYTTGGPVPKIAKSSAKKDSVPSEMFPGKMIPIEKSNYENKNFDKMFKSAPKKSAPVKNKAKSGASLKPVPEDKKGNLGKLPTAVRNKMGFQKDGGKTKAKGGAKVAKKMMGGGKCKYGC